MEGPVTLRRFALEDVEPVLAIQRACPELAQWTQRDYERVARDEMAGWVATQDGTIIGFVVTRKIADEMEILNLAVTADARRRRVGSELLAATFEWGCAERIRRACLEVRASNLAAIRFYEQHKFEGIGRRPRYYTAPIEDAIVLAREVD